MKINFKTKEQLEQEEKEAELQQWENSIRNAYRNEADPLNMKWQRGEIEKQVWLDKIEEIRQRIPKPELE